MFDVHAAVKAGPVTAIDRHRGLCTERGVRELAAAVRHDAAASAALDVCFCDDADAREWIARERGSIR